MGLLIDFRMLFVVAMCGALCLRCSSSAEVYAQDGGFDAGIDGGEVDAGIDAGMTPDAGGIPPSDAGTRAALTGLWIQLDGKHYVIRPTTEAQWAAVFADPDIAGANAYIRWASLEPTKDTYNWSALDIWLSRASAAHKRIKLAIYSGNDVPDWVYDTDGVTRFNTVFIPGLSSSGTSSEGCTPMTTPVFFEPAYVSAYNKMLTDVAGHIQDAGQMSLIAHVGVSGINFATEELRLPSNDGTQTGAGGCASHNDVDQWLNLGYRPAKVLETYKSFANTIATNFPGVPFGTPFITVIAFPGIDKDGNKVSTAVATPQLNNLIVDWATTTYGSRWTAQSNGLKPPTYNPSVLQYAGPKGAYIGTQFFERGFGDPNCSLNTAGADPFDVASNNKAYDIAKANGWHWVEVFYAQWLCYQGPSGSIHYGAVAMGP